MDDNAERELLHRAQEGNAAAFEQLVAPYRLSLVRICWWYLKDADLAEHTAIVAEERAWYHLKHCRKSLKCWLIKIGRNAALDVTRKPDYRNTVSLPIDDDLPIQDPRVPFEEIVIRNLDLEDLLSQLSERERDLIALVYYAGLKFEEAAEILGMTPDNARKIHERTIKKLKKFGIR